jgi:hypothetical protein
MNPVRSETAQSPRILIAPQAFRRLKLYIDLCPFEVGGLGTVEARGDEVLVSDIVLIRQRASNSDTELDPQAVADHLLGIIEEGKDPASLRLWWHSHAEADIGWSQTDEKTIEALRIEQLVSIVGNKRHDFTCRMDRFSPERVTLDGLPLVPADEEPSVDDPIRQQVIAELREKVTLIHRDVSDVPEIFLDPSTTLEIAIPFDEQQRADARPGGPAE